MIDIDYRVYRSCTHGIMMSDAQLPDLTYQPSQIEAEDRLRANSMPHHPSCRAKPLFLFFRRTVDFAMDYRETDRTISCFRNPILVNLEPANPFPGAIL